MHGFLITDYIYGNRPYRQATRRSIDLFLIPYRRAQAISHEIELTALNVLAVSAVQLWQFFTGHSAGVLSLIRRYTDIGRERAVAAWELRLRRRTRWLRCVRVQDDGHQGYSVDRGLHHAQQACPTKVCKQAPPRQEGSSSRSRSQVSNTHWSGWRL